MLVIDMVNKKKGLALCLRSISGIVVLMHVHFLFVFHASNNVTLHVGLYERSNAVYKLRANFNYFWNFGNNFES